MVETPDSVTFSNGGYFLPGSVRNAIGQTGPQKYYRNYALCQGMVNFNMIDTIGRGIRKVFTEQQKRFFPMPDYQIGQAKKEVTKIYGKLIKSKFSRTINFNMAEMLKTKENRRIAICPPFSRTSDLKLSRSYAAFMYNNAKISRTLWLCGNSFVPLHPR